MSGGAPADASVVAGFRADERGERWHYAGPLRFENAEAALEAAQALALPSSGDVDLSAVVSADSAVLGVLLALRRRARAEGRDLAYAAMPASLVSLAQVYGIDALLGGGG